MTDIEVGNHLLVFVKNRKTTDTYVFYNIVSSQSIKCQHQQYDNQQFCLYFAVVPIFCIIDKMQIIKKL